MADDVKRTLVQLDYDQASGKRVQAGTAAVKRELLDLDKTVQSAEVQFTKYGKVAQDVGRRMDQLADGMQAARRKFGASAASMGEFGDEAKRVANRGDELRSALRCVREEVSKTDGVFAQARGIRQYEASLKDARQEAQTLGRFEGGVRGVASAAGTLGGTDIQSQIGIGAELVNAAQGFQIMRAELPTLAAQLGTSTLALGALGAGIVALGLVVDIFNSKISDTGNVTRSFIDANQKYAEVIATGTTEDVRNAIQAEEDRQKALRIEREALEGFLTQVDELDGVAGTFFDVNAALDDLHDAFGVNVGGVEDVKDRLGDLNSELGASEQVTGRWQDALEDGATAANDAADAEQRLYDKRQELLDQEQQAVGSALNMTEEQLDQKLASLGQEFDYWFQRGSKSGQQLTGKPAGEEADEIKQMQDYADDQVVRIHNEELLWESMRGLIQMLDKQRQAVEDITSAGDDYVQAFSDASRMTSDQAQAEVDLNNIRLDALEKEREAFVKLAGVDPEDPEALNKALEKLAEDNPLAAEALKAVNDEIANLTHRTDQLNEVIIPAAEARELEARMAKRFAAEAGRLTQAGDDLADSLAKTAEEEQKYADTLAKRELKLTQDAEKFALERTRDLADHYAEMAELDADYYRERGDIIRDMRADLADIDQERIDELADLNEDLAVLARDHADSMRKIERDANRDLQTAAARFDAWGIFQAQQSRRDALEDEQDQYTKEKEEREEQFADRLKMLDREREETQRAAEQALRDLEDQHRRERSAKERAVAEELRREDENRRLQLRHQKQQWDLEDKQRQDHYDKQSGRTVTHYANLEGMADTHFANMEAKFAASFSKMAAGASLPSSAGAVAQDAIDFFLGTMGTPSPGAAAASRGPEAARFAPARPGAGALGGSSIGSIQFGDIIVPAVAGGVSPGDIKSAVYDAVIEAAEAIA